MVTRGYLCDCMCRMWTFEGLLVGTNLKSQTGGGAGLVTVCSGGGPGRHPAHLRDTHSTKALSEPK